MDKKKYRKNKEGIKNKKNKWKRVKKERWTRRNKEEIKKE